MPGTLYIVGTPIGNLADITLRAIETLKNSDVIAAEDTRHSARLLSHLDIHKQLISFHEHSGQGRADEILQLLSEGKNVALVSDAGMPLISDPGYLLVRSCIAEDIPVTVVPGPSAVTAAIALSGIDCRRFVFGGFLASKQTERRRQLQSLSLAGTPIVLYESPNRVTDLLEDICEVLGAGTPVSAAKEITKIHETVARGTAQEVLERFSGSEPPKGEFVVVVGAREETRELSDEEVEEKLAEFIAQGMSKRDAVRHASMVYSLPKKRVYSVLLSMEGASSGK